MEFAQNLSIPFKVNYFIDNEKFNEFINWASENTNQIPWKETLCKVAIFAPSYILSQVGWTIGLILGGPLGAGAGNMAGTLFGSILSIGIELLIEKYVKNNTKLETYDQILAFVMPKMKEAALFSCGSFPSGFVSCSAIRWTKPLHIKHFHLFQDIAAIALISLSGVAGVTSGRIIYTATHHLFNFEKDDDYKKLKCSWTHLQNDLIPTVVNVCILWLITSSSSQVPNKYHNHAKIAPC